MYCSPEPTGCYAKAYEMKGIALIEAGRYISMVRGLYALNFALLDFKRHDEA